MRGNQPKPQQMELKRANRSLVGQNTGQPARLKIEEESPQNEEAIKGEVPNLQINTTFVD